MIGRPRRTPTPATGGFARRQHSRSRSRRPSRPRVPARAPRRQPAVLQHVRAAAEQDALARRGRSGSTSTIARVALGHLRPSATSRLMSTSPTPRRSSGAAAQPVTHPFVGSITTRSSRRSRPAHARRDAFHQGGHRRLPPALHRRLALPERQRPDGRGTRLQRPRAAPREPRADPQYPTSTAWWCGRRA